MGVASAIGAYDSCCVSAAALLAAADSVIAYITVDDWPNISSVLSRHGAKRRMWRLAVTKSWNRNCLTGGSVAEWLACWIQAQ